jgi:hypothetical protein
VTAITTPSDTGAHQQKLTQNLNSNRKSSPLGTGSNLNSNRKPQIASTQIRSKLENAKEMLAEGAGVSPPSERGRQVRLRGWLLGDG